MAVRKSLLETVELSPNHQILFEDVGRLNFEELKKFLDDPKKYPIAKLSEEFCIDFNYQNITLRGYEIQKGFLVSPKGRDFFHIPLLLPPQKVLEVFSYFYHLHRPSKN
jgi:hypothetical protein